MDHPKASHKLYIRQAEKIFQLGSGKIFNRPLIALNNDTQKSKKFLDEKKLNITERAHAF